jgi:hypothetical protein
VAVNDKCPEVPLELAEYLVAQYPPKCLKPGEDVSLHYRYGGAADLAAFLLDVAKSRTESGAVEGVIPEDAHSVT